jgi:hypothetical protein
MMLLPTEFNSRGWSVLYKYFGFNYLLFSKFEHNINFYFNNKNTIHYIEIHHK